MISYVYVLRDIVWTTFILSTFLRYLDIDCIYVYNRHISFISPWKFSRNLIIPFIQFLAEMYKQENLWIIFKEWCCGSLFKKEHSTGAIFFWLTELFRNGKKLMEPFFVEWSTKNIFYQSFFEKYYHNSLRNNRKKVP